MILKPANSRSLLRWSLHRPSLINQRNSSPFLNFHCNNFSSSDTPHASSTQPSASLRDFFNPTNTHTQLRTMLRDFVENEVEPQALEHDRKESFNLPLLKRLGNLGLFGLTVEAEYGGSGLDATAVALVHEELSYSDPGFCLSYLAHSLLLVNNISVNGTSKQKERFLPSTVTGEHLGGMGMSEPNAGMCSTVRKP